MHLCDHFTPQFGAFKHIGFINGTKFFTALGGQLKSHLGNTFDFAGGVNKGVDPNLVYGFFAGSIGTMIPAYFAIRKAKGENPL